VGSFVDLRSAQEQGASVEVIDPDGKHPLSLQGSKHIANPSRSRARASTRFTAPTDGRSWSRFMPTAANRTWPPSLPKRWGYGRTPARASAQAATAEEAAERTKPWSLWRYALFLVLLAAITESFFATRYLSVQKDEAT